MTSQDAAAAAASAAPRSTAQQQPQQQLLQQQLLLLQEDSRPQNPLSAFVAAALDPSGLQDQAAAAGAAAATATATAAEAGGGAQDKQPQRAFAVLFHLFTEGRGLPAAALEAATAADAAVAAAAGRSSSSSSSICLLRGDNVRRLIAQQLRQQSGELGGPDSWGKVAKVFISFVLADSSVRAAAKTEVLLAVLRLLFFLLPRSEAEASSSLDLNVLVDFLGECSKLLPLQSLPAVVQLLAEQRGVCAEAFRRKSKDDKPVAAAGAGAAPAAAPAAAAAAAAAAESRRRMQVAGAKVIGMIKAMEERLRLSQQTHLIFELRLLLAETLALTHAGVSNRTLQRAEAPKPRIDDEAAWRECAVNLGEELHADDCPYTQFLQAPDSVLAQGSEDTVAAVNAVQQVLGYLEAHHFKNAAASSSSSSSSNDSSSNSSGRRCPHCSCGRKQPPHLLAAAAAAAAAPTEARSSPEVGGVASTFAAAAAAAAGSSSSSSSSSSSEFAKEALRDLHVSVARITRLAFPSIRCSSCGLFADCFPPTSSSSSRSVQQTPLWKLLCGEELWQRWKTRSSFEGALLPLTADVLTPVPAAAPPTAAAADKGQQQPPMDIGAQPATLLLKHCVDVAVHALAHPFSAAAAAAAPGHASSSNGGLQQQQDEPAAELGELEIPDLTAAAAAAVAAADRPAAEAAETLQQSAAAAAAAASLRAKRSRPPHHSANESLEDFYDWLLLWESTGAAAAPKPAAAATAAAASPLLQPPPISLLRQTEEWYLLRDNPPPADYLKLSLTAKLQHKLKDYLLKMKLDADPANEVPPEDASAANPFFATRMQRLFYQFHCDRFDLLPMKTTRCEALSEALDGLAEGREGRKQSASKLRGVQTAADAAAAAAPAIAAAADALSSAASTPKRRLAAAADTAAAGAAEAAAADTPEAAAAAETPAAAEAAPAANTGAEGAAMDVDGSSTATQQQQQQQQQQQVMNKKVAEGAG
ncbi:hypothetical protein Efla_001556 [Eimeria flavescens]